MTTLNGDSLKRGPPIVDHLYFTSEFAAGKTYGKITAFNAHRKKWVNIGYIGTRTIH